LYATETSFSLFGKVSNSNMRNASAIFTAGERFIKA